MINIDPKGLILHLIALSHLFEVAQSYKVSILIIHEHAFYLIQSSLIFIQGIHSEVLYVSNIFDFVVS
jgi:hypothetical protein